MDNYDDIINLPHHVSQRHPRMSMYNRAAQFSPFAALTGYEKAIEEARKKQEAEVRRRNFHGWRLQADGANRTQSIIYSISSLLTGSSVYFRTEKRFIANSLNVIS